LLSGQLAQGETILSAATLPISLEKLFYSRNETAQLLGVSVGTIDNLIDRGELPFKRIGGPVRGRVLISRATLLKLAEGESSKG